MQAYLDCLQYILDHGIEKTDRTGVGTISVFGYQNRFDLSEGFPLMTTKRVPFRLISSELLWFLHGDTNIQYLLKHNNHIWDEWAFERWIKSPAYKGPDMTNFGLRAEEDPHFKALYDEELENFLDRIINDDDFAKIYGDLGNIYGKQWRHFQGADGKEVDQIAILLDLIKHQPDSRRMILSAWNPTEIADMALPPCHTLSQFYISNGKLSCQLYQRSADVFLGVPFNIASYSLLTHLLAREAGLEVGEFVHTFGDLHIYKNHFEQVHEQLSRKAKALPQLKIREGAGDIFNLKVEDIEIIGYQPHKAIKAPVAV